MIIGTAPVGMVDEALVNVPTLCYTYAEAVAAFGYVPAKAPKAGALKRFEYSISEFISAAFSLFQASPVIIVNVLDPSKHVKSLSRSLTVNTSTSSITVEETGVIQSTVKIKQGEAELTNGDQYVLDFDDDGNLVVTFLKVDSYTTDTVLTLTAQQTDPTAVTADDIIGGVNTEGVKSGLELVEEAFPRFRLVPGTILAPGFSEKPSVAATMAAKCSAINGLFKAICVVDVPTDEVKQYSAVAAWKNNNNITSETQVACWPQVQLDDTVYHLSTQLACLMPQVDADNDDVPYVSPSNQSLQMTGMCLADDSEVVFGQDSGAYLNSQGVFTALNFSGGWKAWGNRTAIYPASTDVKDAFIPVRRMFNWVGNTLIQTFWQRVDAPLNRRQIDTIVDSANMWLNGLTARQFIFGAAKSSSFLTKTRPRT